MLSEKQNNIASNSFVIETKNLTKCFDSFKALTDVSLKVREGSVHAIVGENGAGKTTLLKHLFGLLQPTSGGVYLRDQRVSWNSALDAIANGIGMVQQHFTLVDELSAIDNIMLGAETVGVLGRLSRRRAIAQIEKTLPSEFLSVPWRQQVQNLTVGQKQKVEILKLLFRQSQILILDEPTAVLTPQEIKDFFAVLKVLRDRGCTVIIITHKLSEVFSLSDEISVLRTGNLVGSYKTAETSLEQIVELMIGRKPQELPIHREVPHESEILECEELTETELDRGSLRGASFKLLKGEIVGIAGVEGSGQSHLVEVLLGLRPFKGSAKLFGKSLTEQSPRKIRRQLGLVPEDRLSQGLWPRESCYHNLIIGFERKFSHYGWLSEAEIRRVTPQWAQSLDLRASSLDVAAGSLSGGNQQKLILARETRGQNSELLICHHPTRGVDLGAIELIHNEFLRLRNEGHGLLVISSDLDELMAVSDRIVVMYEGKTVKEFIRDEFDALEIGRYMTGASG